MKYRVETYKLFDKEFKRLGKKYRSLGQDYLRLIEELERNPLVGVDLGNNLRKIRMAITSKGKGKSHGARVISYTAIVNVEEGLITLLTIYDKGERDTLSDKEIVALYAAFKQME